MRSPRWACQPMRFLVVPRMAALTFVEPALTLMAHVHRHRAAACSSRRSCSTCRRRRSGRASSSACGLWRLRAGPRQELRVRVDHRVRRRHLGLRASGDASSVGSATTRTVVVSIFFIIVVDAVFATVITLVRHHDGRVLAARRRLGRLRQAGARARRTSRSTAARSSRCSAARAAASRRCCARSAAWCRRSPARCRCSASRCTSCRPSERDPLLQRIGFAFQQDALFSSMTIEDNVALPLRELTKLPDADGREMVRMRLALVGLEGLGAAHAVAASRAVSASAPHSPARRSSIPS